MLRQRRRSAGTPGNPPGLPGVADRIPVTAQGGVRGPSRGLERRGRRCETAGRLPLLRRHSGDDYGQETDALVSRTFAGHTTPAQSYANCFAGKLKTDTCKFRKQLTMVFSRCRHSVRLPDTHQVEEVSAVITVPVIPDFELAGVIENAARAASSLCWTCSTCDNECPVNIATGRLRPQKIVRMASLGMLAELVALPEIWYCLNCRRCRQACPNRVEPFAVIAYVQNEAVRRGEVTGEATRRRGRLLADFQRVRWHGIRHCLAGRRPAISDDTWREWAQAPVRETSAAISQTVVRHGSGPFRRSVLAANTWSCMTCSECSSGCPVCFERAVFDPQRLIRMAVLGLEEEVLTSPSLWLCLDCGRCSSACSQQVRGRDIIRRLQHLAVARGLVDDGFARRLEEVDRRLYGLLLSAMDALLTPTP